MHISKKHKKSKKVLKKTVHHDRLNIKSEEYRNIKRQFKNIIVIGYSYACLKEDKKSFKKLVKKLKAQKKDLATSTAINLATTGLVMGVTAIPGVNVAALVGIALGKWTIGKIRKEIKRRKELKELRNWVSKHIEAQNDRKDIKLTNAHLANEAIRRAIDHFRKAQKIEQEELDIDKLLMYKYKTCNDAITHSLLIANFMHEVNKSLIYLLPCLDIVYEVLKQYKNFITFWEKKLRRTLRKNMSLLLANIDHDEVCGRLCFADFLISEQVNMYYILESIFDAKDSKKKFRKKVVEVMENFADQKRKLEEQLKTIKDPLEKKRIKSKIFEIENQIKQKGEAMTFSPEIVKTKLPNIEEIDEKIKRLGIFVTRFTKEINDIKSDKRFDIVKLSGKWGTGPDSGTKERMELLLKDVIKKVDNPKVWTRLKHRVRNWNTRKTQGEKFSGVFSDVIDLATATISPWFQPGHDIVNAVTINQEKKMIKKAASAISSLSKSFISYEASKISEKKSITNSFEPPPLLYYNLKHEGIKISNLIEEMILNFLLAMDEIKTAENKLNKYIKMIPKHPEMVSCDDVWEVIRSIGRAFYLFSLLELSVNTIINLLEQMAFQICSWVNIYNTLWNDLQKNLAKWLGTANINAHKLCKKEKSYCYGPRYENFKIPIRPL